MSDVHNDDVKNLLDKNNIQHTEAVMYRTVSNDFTSDEEFDYDMLVFFSPAGVTSLKGRLPRRLYATPDSIWTLKHRLCRLRQ